MSPRRSSRARSSQIPPAAPLHTNSSSSITTVAKENRNTRSNITNTRTASPARRESTVRSESNEDTDTIAQSVDSTIVPRRSRRGEVEAADKKLNSAPEEGDEEVEGVMEEDVTRCICGRPEYPGPGASVQEQLPSGEPLSDEIGNFFVQCDKCHVWQHGGCMGLTDESMLPEEYYCENCMPAYHRIIRGANGSRTSRYLPVLEAAVSDGSSPLSSAGDPPRKGSSKAKSIESTKRRATMNSRGAYDEDEMLRRAIEESKEMGTLKRLRNDSDDPKYAVKRQRTGSTVSSLGSRQSQSPQPHTEDPATASVVNGSKNSSKLRGAAAKNSREKELRDKQKEALATQRAEAASKRNARSERRRVEDSPPPSPALSPSKTISSLARPGLMVKDSTPPAKVPLNRKGQGGRPPARRGRLGRNQYTRDLPINGDTSDSPLRDTSRDPHAIDSPRPHPNGHGYKDGINGESGRSSKAKTHPARMSMNEMKRRVAAILEFVGRMQSDRGAATKSNSSNGSGSSSLKGNSTPNGSNSTTNLPTASLVRAVTQGLEEGKVQKGKSESDTSDEAIIKVELLPEKMFGSMNSLEMMETLTTELVKWQTVYGIYGKG